MKANMMRQPCSGLYRSNDEHRFASVLKEGASPLELYFQAQKSVSIPGGKAGGSFRYRHVPSPPKEESPMISGTKEDLMTHEIIQEATLLLAPPQDQGITRRVASCAVIRERSAADSLTMESSDRHSSCFQTSTSNECFFSPVASRRFLGSTSSNSPSRNKITRNGSFPHRHEWIRQREVIDAYQRSLRTAPQTQT